MSWNEIKKARLRLSREQGTIIKDWGGRIPIVLIYPNSYYLGMSNLGIHAIYGLLNSHNKIICERAFWGKANKDGKPSILSLESQRPLSDFTVLAFSITYELDYFNVVQILKTSGIPIYSADRDEKHPLLIAGGPCITANPMPLAPFFDCLCIGEAEPILPTLLTSLCEGINGKRSDLLKSLDSLDGVYAPLVHSGAPVVRQWVKNLDDFPVHSVILTPDTELGNLYLIEAERGCNWSCHFCLTSQAFRPMRLRSIENLIAQAKIGLKYRKRIGLVGPALSSHPQIEELVTRLQQIGAEISISSLRIRPLSHVLLRTIAQGGTRTVALAPESGSQRLLKMIRKDISEDNILEAITKIAEQRIKHIKLYFIIGLPSETDENIDEIIKLTLKCKNILDRQRSGCRLTISVAPFVPKASTPFQWLPMTPLSTLDHRLSLLKNTLQSKGIKLNCESLAWSQVQGVLARGDDKLAHVLTNIEEISLAGWDKAVKKCNIDIDFYAHQIWDATQKLPWATLESGADTKELRLEMERALLTDFQPI